MADALITALLFVVPVVTLIVVSYCAFFTVLSAKLQGHDWRGSGLVMYGVPVASVLIVLGAVGTAIGAAAPAWPVPLIAAALIPATWLLFILVTMIPDLLIELVASRRRK